MRFVVFLTVLLGLISSIIAGDFFVKDGDRVVFLGDSITEQRLYTTYIEAYVLTRYPKWKLTFRNVAYGNVVHAVANPGARHDDPSLKIRKNFGRL